MTQGIIICAFVLLNFWMLKGYLKKQFNEFLIGVKGQLIGDSQIVHKQLSVLTIETSFLKNYIEKTPFILQAFLDKLQAQTAPPAPPAAPVYQGRKRGPRPQTEEQRAEKAKNREKKRLISEKLKATWASYTPEQRAQRVKNLKGKKAAQVEQPINEDASKFAKALVGNG